MRRGLPVGITDQHPAILKVASVAGLTIVALVLGINAVHAAETYAFKPVRVVIPFEPGGSTDIVGRLLSAQLQERLKQAVVIENRGGAGGVIGTEAVARAAPDGYTLLMVNGSHTFNPALYKLNYDPIKSFEPVAMIGSGPLLLAAHPSLPARSVKELIAHAKANPGTLNYSSGGVGAFGHLAGAMFVMQAGVDAVHVPYKGGGPAMTSLVAGNTKFGFGALIQYLAQVKSGGLRALGVSSLRRNPKLPDVPTIAEEGMPGFEAVQWWGFVAPKGTPAAIVTRLHADLTVIQASPQTQKSMESEGAVTTAMSLAEFGKMMETEIVRWAKVVQIAGIQPQ